MKRNHFLLRKKFLKKCPALPITEILNFENFAYLPTTEIDPGDFWHR